MAWISLTAADVQRRLAAAEYTALLNAAKAVSQEADDILAEAIAEITSEVRGYVAACDDNQLGEGATIPSELKATALALVRAYLFTRLPGMRSLNDALRQAETEAAREKLKDVAACRFAIISPETPAAEQAGGPAILLVHSRRRISGREHTNGLL